MSLIALAPELTDSIVDFLHNDPASLKALSAAWRRFLPACRFHLFSELTLESEKLRGKCFPATLTPLVKRVRLSPGYPAAGGFTALPLFTFGSFSIPPPALTGPQLRRCINNIHSPYVELNGVKSSIDHPLFTAVATSDLKHSATSLSLNGCCIDSEDLVTLCYALPRVEALHISALAFDKSQAMIRKIERTAPAPIGFFLPFATSTSDWSSFSESMVSTIKTARLQLKEIVVEGTKWTNELCECLVGLVERIDESVKLTLRVQLPGAIPPRESSSEDAIGEQLELFTRFLEICGAGIDQLDVCLGNGPDCNIPTIKLEKQPLARLESEGAINVQGVTQNLDSDVSLTISSFLEHCPLLEALRLSGSLCSAEVMKQIIQGIRPASERSPSLRVLGLGPVGADIMWSDILHLLAFVGAGASLERVVISEDTSRVIPTEDQCLTHERLRNRGLDVVFAEHRRVGDLL